jgi:hypothetical protein
MSMKWRYTDYTAECFAKRNFYFVVEKSSIEKIIFTVSKTRIFILFFTKSDSRMHSSTVFLRAEHIGRITIDFLLLILPSSCRSILEDAATRRQ